MVVNHTDGLHEGVADRAPDKPEASFLEILTHGLRDRRCGGYFISAFPRILNRLAIHKPSDIGIKTVELLLYFKEGFGVGNCGFDFQSITDDALVTQQPLDALSVIPCDLCRIEV